MSKEKLNAYSVAEKNYDIFFAETSMDIFDENKVVCLIQQSGNIIKLLKQIRQELIEEYEYSLKVKGFSKLYEPLEKVFNKYLNEK